MSEFRKHPKCILGNCKKDGPNPGRVKRLKITKGGVLVDVWVRCHCCERLFRQDAEKTAEAAA